MKIIKNHALQEAVLLLGMSITLVVYSLNGYNAAYNKDWTQSPFLFPLVIAGIFGLLSIVIAASGVLGLLKEDKAEAKAAEERPSSAQPAVEADTAKSGARHELAGVVRVLVTIIICAVYYWALSAVKMPYLGVSFLNNKFTLRFSTFELVTPFMLCGLMYFMGTRKPVLLIAVPLGTTVFLSVAFRTLLHVMLP